MPLFESRGKMAVISEEMDGPITVLGDLHGDNAAFERVRDSFLSRGGLLVLLGDYADRGSRGLEVIEGVRDLMDRCPGRVIALKGNHEDYAGGVPKAIPCDLRREAEVKTSLSWEEYFPHLDRTFLSRLHLCALAPGTALFVHGGISSRIGGVGDLERPDVELEEDIMWSDPVEMEGEMPGNRRAGVIFGKDVTERVLARIGVKYLIRSHEPRKVMKGPAVEHEGRVITVSTTSVCGGMLFYLVIDSLSSFDSSNIRRYARFL